MNERIQEVAVKAKLMAEEDINRQISYNAELKAFAEKFAELIIGHATECVRDVLRDENSDLSYHAASQVQNRIREYFGVEK